MSGSAKAQLGDAASGDKKAWFCSEFVSEAFVRAGHPLTLAQAAWISPSDLLHMREGDVATFKPETAAPVCRAFETGSLSSGR